MQRIAALVHGLGRKMIEESGGFLQMEDLGELWHDSVVPTNLQMPLLDMLARIDMLLVKTSQDNGTYTTCLAHFYNIFLRQMQSLRPSSFLPFSLHLRKVTFNTSGSLVELKRNGWADTSCSIT